MSRAMLQNVANFRSTIDAAPMCQVNVCLQNNKSEQCSHVWCYFHSAGWHPLFSLMILFLCTNWESDLTQRTSWIFPRNGTVPFSIRGVILFKDDGRCLFWNLFQDPYFSLTTNKQKFKFITFIFCYSRRRSGNLILSFAKLRCPSLSGSDSQTVPHDKNGI